MEHRRPRLQSSRGARPRASTLHVGARHALPLQYRPQLAICVPAEGGQNLRESVSICG